jgi:hypothetical protein
MSEAMQWVIVGGAVLLSLFWLLRHRLPGRRRVDAVACGTAPPRSTCAACGGCALAGRANGKPAGSN